MPFISGGAITLLLSLVMFMSMMNVRPMWVRMLNRLVRVSMSMVCRYKQIRMFMGVVPIVVAMEMFVCYRIMTMRVCMVVHQKQRSTKEKNWDRYHIHHRK